MLNPHSLNCLSSTVNSNGKSQLEMHHEHINSAVDSWIVGGRVDLLSSPPHATPNHRSQPLSFINFEVVAIE